MTWSANEHFSTRQPAESLQHKRKLIAYLFDKGWQRTKRRDNKDFVEKIENINDVEQDISKYDDTNVSDSKEIVTSPSSSQSYYNISKRINRYLGLLYKSVR